MNNIVNISFSLDGNVIIHAGVCITSLLENSNINTFYNIHILYSANYVTNEDKETLNKLLKAYKNFKMEFINVGDYFKGAFEIRNITSATYYRLLLPELLPEIDSIIYADTDMIFLGDLFDIYSSTLQKNDLVAGVRIQGIEDKYLNTLGLTKANYINGGFLIMNLNLMRIEKIEKTFLSHAENKYKYQDQDILNIVCNSRIEYISSVYNSSPIDKGHDNIVIHYAGVKPWNAFREKCDIWWEYYRKSEFYDVDYYHSYFTSIQVFDYVSIRLLLKSVFRKISFKLFKYFN